MKNFEFIPAIDVLGGRCVQLTQGKYDRVTVFDDDPVAVAAKFTAHPIRRLHVVDLDGAKGGRRCNMYPMGRFDSFRGARLWKPSLSRNPMDLLDTGRVYHSECLVQGKKKRPKMGRLLERGGTSKMSVLNPPHEVKPVGGRGYGVPRSPHRRRERTINRPCGQTRPRTRFRGPYPPSCHTGRLPRREQDPP